MEGTLREYKSPRKRFCRQHLATLATPTILRFASSEIPVGAILWTIAGLRSFWPLLPHHSTGRNETRTWYALSPRNVRIKFGANPSAIFLVIVPFVVTYRHTDTHRHTQTNAGENIFPRFRGDNNGVYRTSSMRLRRKTGRHVLVEIYMYKTDIANDDLNETYTRARKTLILRKAGPWENSNLDFCTVSL